MRRYIWAFSIAVWACTAVAFADTALKPMQWSGHMYDPQWVEDVLISRILRGGQQCLVKPGTQVTVAGRNAAQTEYLVKITSLRLVDGIEPKMCRVGVGFFMSRERFELLYEGYQAYLRRSLLIEEKVQDYLSRPPPGQ